MNELLTVNNLYHRYQDGSKTRAVLKDVNLTFETGKMYAIVGSSGSGKTTLLSLIGGLDDVQEGDIIYDGQSLKKIGLTNYRKNNVNIIFQSYNLIKYMNAIQNVVVAMDIKKVKDVDKKKKALDILNELGIDDDTAKRDILKISGGEQQRVAIARALAHNSSLIMADEPTGNLDDETEEEIIDIFKKLAKEGKCVIIVTHSSSVAKQADVIYAITKGKIEKVDPQVITAPELILS